MSPLTKFPLGNILIRSTPVYVYYCLYQQQQCPANTARTAAASTAVPGPGSSTTGPLRGCDSTVVAASIRPPQCGHIEACAHPVVGGS